MKHPFKLSKTNIIYALIVSILLIALNSRTHGFDAFAFGYSFGTIIALFLFSTIVALFFWFILGRKKNGGTIAFNIVVTLFFLGQISQFIQRSGERKKSMDDIENAVVDYKEKSLTNQYDNDSLNKNYSELLNNLEKGIDGMINTSHGEEKKLYTILKKYFKKADSINSEWNIAYNDFNDPRIFDFTKLNNEEEFKFQKKVIQDYIDRSIDLKIFMSNRISYLKTLTKDIDKKSKVYIGFLRGMNNKDSIQQPVFKDYITAHISYGKKVKEVIELLEQKKGKWQYKNDDMIFNNSKYQTIYNNLIDTLFIKEEKVNEYHAKLIETM